MTKLTVSIFKTATGQILFAEPGSEDATAFAAQEHELLAEQAEINLVEISGF